MKKTLAILAVSPVLCATAWAGPVQQRLPDSPYQDGGQVRASGEELKFGVVRGTGQDVPLYKALTSIIPRGYTLRTVGVERWLLDEPVNWAGGREWTEVLSEAISNYPELTVDIATGSKVVILRQTYSSGDGSYAQHAFAAPAAQKAPVAARVPTQWGPAPAEADAEASVKNTKTAKAPKNTTTRVEPVGYAAPQAAARPYDAGPYMDMPRLKQSRVLAEDMPNAAVPQKADIAVAEPARKVEAVKVAATSEPAQKSAAGVTWPAVEKALESAQIVREEKATTQLVITKAELEAVKAELVVAKAELKTAKSEPAAKAKPAAETVQGAAPKTEAIAETKPAAGFKGESDVDKLQLAAAKVPEAEPAVAKSAPAAPKPIWDIKSADKTLKAAIERWSSTSGWQISWELLVDYPVEATASITGSFEEAVEVVVKSMEHAEVPMKAIFYSGNKVLRIVAKGTE